MRLEISTECPLKTSWKWPKLKWQCIQVGPSNVKDHNITADIQPGISDKQQAETEGLSPRPGSDLPEGQGRAPSSDRDGIFPWWSLGGCTEDRLARLMQSMKASRSFPDAGVTRMSALWPGNTQSKPQWQVNTEGCEFVRFHRLRGPWTQCLWKIISWWSGCCQGPYGEASHALCLRNSASRIPREGWRTQTLSCSIYNSWEGPFSHNECCISQKEKVSFFNPLIEVKQ